MAVPDTTCMMVAIASEAPDRSVGNTSSVTQSPIAKRTTQMTAIKKVDRNTVTMRRLR